MRYGGADRFDTATIIANLGLGNPGTVFLTTGTNFPDALVSGVAAAKVHGAVVLTAGGVTPTVSADYLQAHPADVVHGVGPVAAAGMADRFAGTDRYDTARLVAAHFFSAPASVGLASGVSFADAMSGGAHIARFGGPLLLSDPNALSPPTQSYLSANEATVATAYVYGGTAAVSSLTQASVAAAITGTGAPASAAITSPLRVSSANPHFLTDASGRAVYLAGSHTWDDMQDLSVTPNAPAAFDFNAFVQFLVAHGQNMTILWRKDLPTFCNWGAGGTWHASQFPWSRTGPAIASDGLPAFDLSQFDQSFFDRLRARVVQLEQNNVYATVQLFDGLQLINNRCPNDGYPFSAGNNVNGVADGGGTGSMTMTAPDAITNFQDAFVKKVIDTLNDLPNVLWEVSEEAPSNSTWWQDHMISLIHSYEATKPLQHPVGYPWLTGGSDGTIYSSAADWVAPSAKVSPTTNPGNKAIVNDSDHSYYGMWNDSAQTNRNYLWENFTNGSSVVFMDPYEIYWSSGGRNLCQNPVNGVCNGVDPRWDNFRNNLGYAVAYANKMNLAAMTPHGGLASTGWALANTAPTGSEFLVYAPNGGPFTVNLSNTSRILNVEWLNPSTGVTSAAGTVNGGSSSQSFTPPFGGDAVLHVWDPSQH